MARDYNVNLSVQGGNRRGAFTGGNLAKNKTTLDSRMNGQQESGSKISSSNLKKAFGIGLAFNSLQKATEGFGAYTENRLRQGKINVAMTAVKYGIGLAINPIAGAIYAVSDIGYRAAMYAIRIQKKTREASFFKRLSGNNTNSGRRYRGDFS